MRFNLSFLLFMVCVFLWSTKLCLLPNHKDLLILFFSRSFRVLTLTFRPLICLELIFVLIWVRIKVHFFPHKDIKFSQHHLLKKTFFTPLNYCGILVKYRLSIDMWVYFWTLYSVPLNYISIFRKLDSIVTC